MIMIRLKVFYIILHFHSTYHLTAGNKLFRDSKIIGGKNTNISETAYQATVEYYGEVSCGACLISLDWLVSAAHCVANIQLIDIKNFLRVRVGSSFKRRDGFLHTVKRVEVHPQYNKVTNENDISLMKFDKDIVSDANKAPIGIVGPDFKLSSGTKIKLSGFGLTQAGGNPSNMLQSAVVQVTSDSVCYGAYKKGVIRPSMFCADARSATSCKGDSGGPGVINGKLAGVIAADWHCQPSRHPTVLTKVAPYFYWIVNVTQLML